MVPSRRTPPRLDAAAVDQRLPKQELDLAVEAAELVRSPTAQFLEIFSLEAQEECLSFSHVLLIDRAGVDNRLSRPVAAQNYEQVADHRSAAFLVEFDHLVF